MSVFLGALPVAKRAPEPAREAPRDLEALSRDELVAEATRMGLKFTSKTTKAQLRAMIKEAMG